MTAVNRVERLIINLDTASPLTCGWDECDRRARTTYQVRTHEHPSHVSCSDVAAGFGMLGRHVIYAFCSAGHLDYWVSCSGVRAHDLADRNRGLIYGQHSAGNRLINR
jgi:hypothetical protein